MKVTNVTVRYDRSRQPAKYESAEAMVEFTATLEATVSTDDDYHATAVALLGEAKTIVLTELGLVAAGSSASAHAALPAAAAAAATPAVPAADTSKPAAAATGTRRKTDKVAPAAPATAVAAAPAKPAEAAVGDIPVEPAAKPAETALGRALPEAKAAAAIGDIPVEAGPAKTAPVAASPAQVTHAGGDELTPGAVQKYITSKLVAKAFLPNVVLGVLKNDYKVDRVFDLPADKLAEFYAKIKKLAGE